MIDALKTTRRGFLIRTVASAGLAVSSPASAAALLLGSRGVSASGRGAGLPYDCEIAWISRSENTVYIDTGTTVRSGCRYECDFSTEFSTRGSRAVFGTPDSTLFSFSYSSTQTNQMRIGSDYYSLTAAYHDGVRRTVICDLRENFVSYGGVRADISAASDIAYPIALLRSSTNTLDRTLRIYGWRVYDGNRLVQDMVPVSSGGVGCMFDRVAGALTRPTGDETAIVTGPETT